MSEKGQPTKGPEGEDAKGAREDPPGRGVRGTRVVHYRRREKGFMDDPCARIQGTSHGSKVRWTGQGECICQSPPDPGTNRSAGVGGPNATRGRLRRAESPLETDDLGVQLSSQGFLPYQEISSFKIFLKTHKIV